MTEQLFSVREVAERLGVHVSTIRRYESTGQLRPVFRTPGGHRRYRLADIQRIQREERRVL